MNNIECYAAGLALGALTVFAFSGPQGDFCEGFTKEYVESWCSGQGASCVVPKTIAACPTHPIGGEAEGALMAAYVVGRDKAWTQAILTPALKHQPSLLDSYLPQDQEL